VGGNGRVTAQDARRVLRTALGMISLDGVPGPVELARCRFLRRYDVEAEQAFVVDVVASDAAGTAAVEVPVVSLRFTGR
jgi:hypothetical protein